MRKYTRIYRNNPALPKEMSPHFAAIAAVYGNFETHHLYSIHQHTRRFHIAGVFLVLRSFKNREYK